MTGGTSSEGRTLHVTAVVDMGATTGAFSHNRDWLEGFTFFLLGFPGGSLGEESACSAGDLGLTPGSGRSPGEENGYPLQYSSLENPMDRGAWQAIYSLRVRRVRCD